METLVTSSAIPYLKILYPILTWGLPPRLGPPPSKSGAVNVHLRRIVNNLKMISKMSTLPPLEKFLRTPMGPSISISNV